MTLKSSKPKLLLGKKSVHGAILLAVLMLTIVSGTAFVMLSRAATVVGDLNNDNTVNVFDLSILLSNWGKTGVAADLNNDGAVNIFDLSMLLSHWGQTGTPAPSPTPTPSPSPSPSQSPTPSPSSPPTACASGGNYLWSNLETCGWPGPANTGYKLAACPGGVLTVNSGSTTRIITASTANATISCQDITGCLNITAQNVTVQNVKIACTSGKTGTNANGTSVINIDDGASATVTNVEINGMSGVHACIWHQGMSLSVSGVNCYGINDGIFSWADTGYSATTGDNFTIKDSYFHDFTVKTANGHIDGYQTEGAGNGLIDHNTFLMTSDQSNDSDSAVAIWDSLKNSHDITTSNNLIAGGGFAIYDEDYSPSEASPSGGYSITNTNFTNNKFSNHLFGCIGYYGVWYPRGNPSDKWNRSGNVVLETGANVDNGNPTYNGSPCN